MEHLQTEETPSAEHIPTSAPWKPKKSRSAPVLGLLAIIGSFLSTVGFFLVLLLSNHKQVESWTSAWKFEPSVLIASLATVAKWFTTHASTHALAIVWWRSALKGSSLRALSNISSQDKKSLLGLATKKSFDNANIWALSSLLLVLQGLIHPALHQASTTILEDTTSMTDIEVSIAPQLLPRYTAQFTGRSGIPKLMTPRFAEVVQDFLAQRPIQSGSGRCPHNDVCMATIEGAGFDTICEPTSRRSQGNGIFFWENGTLDHIESIPRFVVDLGWAPPQTGLRLSVGYSRSRQGQATRSDMECASDFVETVCVLKPAIIAYDIILKDSTIWLRLRPDKSPRTKEAIANYTEYENTGTFLATLGGFVLLSQKQFNANITMRFGGAVNEEFSGYDIFPSRYLKSGLSSGQCAYYW